MGRVAGRIGITIAAFVIGWLAASFAARWLFGSGNILTWVIAALVAAGVYVALQWRDRHANTGE